MNITEKNYKKWLNYARIITNNKESDDLLHDLFIRLITYNTDPNIINDNYIFISLKNLFLMRLKKDKIELEEEDTLTSLEAQETELEAILIEDNKKQSKLDCISNTILSLNQFERKLYQLHFIYGLSQRKIAREIGVSHLSINQRINKIKQKIIKNYESEN
jgi:RNA polymerase sigma factor (sigma-70 family)